MMILPSTCAQQPRMIPNRGPELISIRSLVKRYRDFTAVDHIDLTLAPGELYVVLGPNGAGKTTTIKCVVGLLHPSSGEIRIGGHDVVRAAAQAKQLIGYIPDRPFLYEKLTGAELIRFMGRLYRTEPSQLARRAEDLLERFRLTGWENELIESYSYGMRQKIVLTAVFARDPQILVIDEPMVGLDPRAAKVLRDLLTELAAAGRTILMSTHSVSLAEQLADRVGIIDRGRLIAEGTIEELRARSGSAGDTGLEELFLALTMEEQASALEATLAAGATTP